MQEKKKYIRILKKQPPPPPPPESSREGREGRYDDTPEREVREEDPGQKKPQQGRSTTALLSLLHLRGGSWMGGTLSVIAKKGMQKILKLYIYIYI